MDAIRIITWRALRGKTWAMNRVYDSPSTPADIRVEVEREPFIAIYVDDADQPEFEGEIGLTLRPNLVKLVIEVAIASPRNADTPATDEVAGVPGTQISATDAALELNMGLIARQVVDALMSTNANNPWAELWRSFLAGGVHSVQIRRGGPGDKPNEPKQRFASRIIALTVDLIADPPRGADLNAYKTWKSFIEACEGDENLAGVGALMRAHIEQPSGAQPDWRQGQKILLTTKHTMWALGVAPQEGFDEGLPGMEIAADLERVTTGNTAGGYQNNPAVDIAADEPTPTEV
jgi:hypothetical protein